MLAINASIFSHALRMYLYGRFKMAKPRDGKPGLHDGGGAGVGSEGSKQPFQSVGVVGEQSEGREGQHRSAENFESDDVPGEIENEDEERGGEGGDGDDLAFVVKTLQLYEEYHFSRHRFLLYIAVIVIGFQAILVSNTL